MFQRVRLHQFRSYQEHEFALSPHVTIISGPNGSGKTNLLEALYVLSKGTSFRAADADLTQFTQPWWRIAGVLQDETKRTVQFDTAKSTSRKQFVLDGAKRQRLSYQQKLPVVLFEPNDLRLLQGSPARRRLFIDTLIAQSEPLYGPLLGKYDRALRQRNNLLKSSTTTSDDLFVWNVSLSEYGARIVAFRQKYVALLRQHISKQYQAIARTQDEVTVSYPYYEEDSSVQQSLLAHLHNNEMRDKALGYTTVGPHRHDVLFFMNGTDVSVVASRGEARSMVLALKLIEVEMLRERRDTPPLLLLDDVFSELDKERRAALIELGATTQTVITTTDADVIRRVSSHKLIPLG